MAPALLQSVLPMTVPASPTTPSSLQERPLPRLPFHEQAIISSTKAAAAASALYDEVRQKKAALEQSIATAAKKDQQALADELAKLEPLVNERQQVAAEAGRALTKAQDELRKERMRVFARLQALTNVELSRAYAQAHSAARAEAEADVEKVRAAYIAERRKQQQARQAAASLASREKAATKYELSSAWRSSVARPTVLDQQARKTLGVGRMWSTSWKGAGGPELFPLAAPARRSKWVVPPAAESAASEPESLTLLKHRLALGLPRVIDTFKKWDVDSDGAVSKDELRQALCMLSVPFDEEALSLLFATMDTDGTGSIDFDELRKALRRHGAEREDPNKISLEMPTRREPDPLGTGAERRAVAALKKALQPRLGKVSELIKEWDIDGDGQVTKRELKRALASQSIPVDRAALNALFRQLDQDNSGSIEFHEIHRTVRRTFASEADLTESYEVSHEGRRRPGTSPAGGSTRLSPLKRTESARLAFVKKIAESGQTAVREMLREKEAQLREKASGEMQRSRTAPNLLKM